MNSNITDREVLDLQERYPEAKIIGKEMAYYYRIFREKFGDIGGKNIFHLYGNY